MNKLFIVFAAVSLLCTQAVMAKQDGGRPGKGNRFLTMFDKNGDGSVTEEEFTSTMKERYQTMDANQDSIVSLEEFKQYSAKRHKNWQKKKHGKMDADQDGAVSKQEFIEHAKKRAEKRFNKLDKNKDGQLNADENVVWQSRKKHHLLEKMDENQDGQISPEEHGKMTQRWFNKMDSNNDKVVSGDELKRRKHR